MAKVSIKNLSQTERNGLFSLVFEGEALSEFEKFIERFKEEADVVRDLNDTCGYKSYDARSWIFGALLSA